MPTYEYVCDKCSHEFEMFQSMKDEPIHVCPKCRSRKVRRLMGMGGGIIFKGSGFYETDYKRKTNGAAASEKSEKEIEKKTETQSESKSETKLEKSKKKEVAA